MDKLNLLALKAKMKFQMILDREEGQDMIEYGLLLGLITVAAVASISTIATDVTTLFSNAASTLA